MAARGCWSPGTVILVATLLCGTLDIADAAIFTLAHGHDPLVMLRSIAACLLGPGAMRGGYAMSFVGLGLHFLIAAFWASFYVLVVGQVSVARRYPLAAGVIYGLLIYLVMNYVVLPHTALHIPLPKGGLGMVNGLLALMLLFGVPVSLLNRKRC
ncbi:hypothetical protein [Terriglobus roseus]|uniref:DUF1440 domain-containing protein n=1 Tax=Terriglobus roseus TaxID=392734 RepID=A0A1G7EV85_9BACT|nr:hypothetical protein [Terriglobus roseus]SDE67603.1 hypothetical protein SAMN05444167_0110 [Terriglobus roseus]